MTEPIDGKPVAPTTNLPAERPRRIIGGSTAAAILGLSKWATPYEIWLEIVQYRDHVIDPAKRRFLNRRKAWEPVVLQMIRDDFEVEIAATNERYKDPEYPFFGCEIDFELDEDGQRVNGEIKTVMPRMFGERSGWGEDWSDEVPIEYEAQVQFGLGVTGRQETVLAALVGIDEVHPYRIKRNEDVIAEMRARLAEWWNRHVVGNVPPDPTNERDLALMFPTSVENTVEASPEVAAAALELRALIAQADANNAKVDALRYLVQRAMGPNERLLVDGKLIFTWKEQASSRFDQSALKEADPKTYRRFIKKGSTRVFRRAAWTK